MKHSGKAWQVGRETTLQRDNHQCQDCGSAEELHVHHIKRPEKFNDRNDAHHPSNLVTLCKYCHKSWEGIDARPVLLDDNGTNLHEVVERLSFQTTSRRALVECAPEAYDFFIKNDGTVCNRCFKRSTRRGYDRVGVFQQTLRQAIMGAGLKAPTTATYYYCPECELKGRPKNDYSTEELISPTPELGERLSEAGYVVDLDRLQTVIAHLKTRREYQGQTGTIYSHAIYAAVDV